MSSGKTDASKWDQFYIDAAAHDSSPPPWESEAAFVPLVEYLDGLDAGALQCMKCIELGCGCSASAVHVAQRAASCTAVDISQNAIDRARRRLDHSDAVNWVVADLLSPDLFASTSLQPESFDFVFDMQCFHVLRSVDEVRSVRVVCDLLKPGGVAMVVTGAHSEEEAALVPGPPTLTRDELVLPFTTPAPSLADASTTSNSSSREECPCQCLQLQSIALTRFNATEHYSRCASRPPLAWVALFRKPL